MDFYGKKNLWKFLLFVFAVLIGAATLWYTESFLDELRKQEVDKVGQFAMAMQNVLDADSVTDISFEQDFIRANTTIPIILTDENGELIGANNIDDRKLGDPEWVREKIEEMSQEAEPLVVDIGKGQVQYLYYQNSILLTKLRYYPMVLLCVISLFIIIAYVAFSNARKSEQNRVWNGLAKETAHQIGTPLSSLMGWLELLRAKDVDAVVVEEMEKDINRLSTITDRFSKIGSIPSITEQDIVEISAEAVSYLKARSPRKVNITFSPAPEMENVRVMLNKPLYEWVIENLIRNAMDALEAKGDIDVSITEHGKFVRVEVKDNGKGIPVNKQKTVFRPGYTTKSRGWGLGLSLAKRIIEDYHNGRIYVASSELGKGTTFRISLRKAV
jgi:nitrogen-specific signal transduction histidine kinase